MGWLFTLGSTRRERIAKRTKGWERAASEMLVESKCLAHCLHGGSFTGVLWSVWKGIYE